MPKWMAMDAMLCSDQWVIGVGGGRLKHTTGEKRTQTAQLSLLPERKANASRMTKKNPSYAQTGGGGNISSSVCRCDKKADSQLAQRGHGKTALQTVRNALLVGTSCYHYARRCSHGYNA